MKIYLQKNQFIVPSYQSYGGHTGFQDYGIHGCKIKNKIVHQWRKIMLDANIHEVELPTITPYDVLKSSGHIDRFTDYVIHDSAGTCLRADHLAKNYFEIRGMTYLANSVDSMSSEMLEQTINKYNMVPGEKYVNVQKKNLMVEVSTKSSDQQNKTDYLRPELAQGIFVNFKQYSNYILHDNFKQFGIAQVGKSYRKEISPQVFTRMREFTQAEIEYFFDPSDPSHNKFNTVKLFNVPILTSEMQLKGIHDAVTVTIEEAVNSGLISHSLMGYFIGKIYKFAITIGLNISKIRFRQHLPEEMSHYAKQCWDLETDVNGSWLECIGCADRGCYDLTAHSEYQNPYMYRKLKTPIIINKHIIVPLVSNIKDYSNKILNILNYFKNLGESETDIHIEMLKNNGYVDIEIDNTPITITESMVQIKDVVEKILYEQFIPNVLEPSFGIDRLIYSVLEHSVWHRLDERRKVLSLSDKLNMYDVAVFPLHKTENIVAIADNIRNALIDEKYVCYEDDTSTAIGKKYVRCDELGVQYVVTVDPGTPDSELVTIRDRDTMQQIYINYITLIELIKQCKKIKKIYKKYQKRIK